MQHLYRLSLTILLLLVSVVGLRAQEQFPPDTLCLMAGGPGFNVVLDDFPAGLEYFVEAQPTECYRIDQLGNVTVPDSVDSELCCGPQPRFFVSVFTPGSDGTPMLLYRQEVLLEIKCPKPDCGVVDLEAIPQPDPVQNPDIPQDIPCINACENSTATYLFSENPALDYVWSVTNGTVDPLPGVPGQVAVTWGPLGPASLSVDIFDDEGNLLTTRSWCVTLTEAPIADFTATSVACLDQDVYFTNTSTGAAATYDWDFGDGNTAQNVATPTAAHAYSSPGTYTVTLVATSNGGLNADGSQACCCTDSISYDITIDPDPGPGIFWISTLCEGDTTKYWTDATNCGSYSWDISANGTITSDPTLDTIMVIWGAGPSGTLELSVNGCDSTYCPTPSIAVVPIISTNGTITGPIEVCGGETANYSLPKWVTTTYAWALPDGGVLNGATDGHQASITWPTTPGTYEIVVEYGSEFLAGLPGHEGDDCYGRAVLEVTVLGNFSLTAAPSPACVDGSTFFNAFSDIGVATYDWSVDGYPSLDAFGQSNYNVTWSDLPGPGVYTITATVTNPGDYCVATKSISVIVKDAVDPVIIGPNDYCVGDPVVYSILSPTPGYTYTWSVAGGSVDAGQFGPTATISFTGATGTVTVTGQDGQAPNCISEPVSISASEIEFNEPANVVGPAACTNSLASYSLDAPQHASATYAWSVMPDIAGSVVAGADTPNATVQWNDTPGSAIIKVDVTICGETRTYSLTLPLNAPIDPVIIQDGDLCIGGSATLYIDSTQFSTIVWDLGGNAGAVWGPNAGSITVFDEGNYVVNTIDINGCPSVDRYRVEAVDGPDVSISAVGARQICVNSPPYPANPVLTATTAAGNTIEWFCGADSQGPAAIGNTTFTHVWTDSVASFVYFARVVDPATGCTEDSDPLIIRQILCCDTPYVADPISQLHTFEATRQSPNCDIVDLVATWSPDSVVGHGFSWDFLGADIISFGGDEVVGNDSMTIRLPGVGCYDIFHNIDVWAFEYDTTFTTDPITGQPIIDEVTKVDSIRCGTTLVQTVCNPLFADFDKREECGTVEFTDESEFDLPSPPPTISYTWDFGDGSTPSNDVNPSHTYGANGTYTVTLTITDGDCVSTAVMTVEVTDLPDADFMVSPNPVCYGQPATFTGTGTNVIEWEWDFADGATFNGNGPQHTFLPALGSGDYDVTLVTTNNAGCRDTVVKTIDVFPTPALDTIEASNGFIICDGDVTVLSVDNIPGLSYLWSTGETTSSITVGTADTYGVTLTNADGCQQVIEPVEVQVIPLPDASWIGNPYICDNGTTKLTALAGGGHTFTWENQTTGQVVSGMMYFVPFSPGNPIQEITLTVTNVAYGCTAESTITVEQVLSPNPDVQITAGGACEGDGTMIEVVNPEPDVTYSWNTGATGTSIFTYAAGTYTVIATNVITGCTGTDQEVVHPLPDICIVPTGCYETCAPDTLIAPSGDYSYAWYQNGTLVGTGDTLIVDESASYSVTVIDNVTGCASISDSLYLEVIDCDDPPGDDCDDIVTRIAPTTIDSDAGTCCFDLYYAGLPAGIHGIQISSDDADLTFVPGSNNPPLNYVGYAGPSVIQLATDVLGSSPIPTSMTGPPALTFCPNDPTAFPQEIIVEYLNDEGKIVCSDTLFTECPVEPDCVYITSDSLYCDDDGGLVFTFTICNPAAAEFAVGYIDLLPASPTAATVLPLGFTLSPALAPGDCRTITTGLPDLPPNANFAYTMIGHSADPDIDPSALCCSDPSVNRELTVPDCDPCDNVGVEGVLQQDEEGCCYDIVLFNEAPAPYTFDGVDLCLIGSDGLLTVYTSIGDPLAGIVNVGGQSVSIFDPTGGVLPTGVFTLPTICIEESEEPIHQIEIKWLSEGGVVCRDTIEVFCTPPCGYLKESEILCKEDAYVWNGDIVNTSGFTMGEAHIEFADSLGLAAYDTTIVFTTPLAPGASQNINLIIGSPAGPGDKITFTVTFHELGPDEFHLNCCQFEVCIELPDCQIEECNCEDPDQFRDDVNMAFDTIGLPLVDPLAYRFDPRADFTSCDSIVWSVRRRNPNGPWQELGSNQVQDYTFPTPGRYQVWMRVYRFADDGELCFARNAFITYNIGTSFTGGGVISPNVGDNTFELEVFPNPTEDVLQVIIPGAINNGSKLLISIYDFQGRRTRDFTWDNPAPGEQRSVSITVNDLPAGVYLLRGTDGAGANWARRFVKQ